MRKNTSAKISFGQIGAHWCQKSAKNGTKIEDLIPLLQSMPCNHSNYKVKPFEAEFVKEILFKYIW